MAKPVIALKVEVAAAALWCVKRWIAEHPDDKGLSMDWSVQARDVLEEKLTWANKTR